MGEKFDLHETLAALRGVGSIGGGVEKSVELTGLKALHLALLEDGIRSYLGKNRSEYEEAVVWIAQRGKRSVWPFSFVTICESLGLDPDAVESALKKFRQEGVKAKTLRSRPNVRSTNRICASSKKGPAPKKV